MKLQLTITENVLKWRQIIRQHEICVEDYLIEANNQGAFCKHVNKRICRRTNIGIITDDYGRMFVSDLDEANSFNRYHAASEVMEN
jgi:hypothetical protein